MHQRCRQTPHATHSMRRESSVVVVAEPSSPNRPVDHSPQPIASPDVASSPSSQLGRAHNALTTTECSALRKAYQQHIEDVQTFWGLFHVIAVVCGIPATPTALERLLSRRADHNDAVASPTTSPATPTEWIDSTGQHQRALEALSEDTFLTLVAELMHHSMASNDTPSDERALIAAALFGEADNSTTNAPPQPSLSNAKAVPPQDPASNIMESIVFDAVSRLRGGAAAPPAALTSTRGRLGDTPTGTLPTYHMEDVELLWGHLFDWRVGTRRTPAADAATFDAAFAKLPKELRDLLLAQGQLDGTSDDASIGDRGGSLYDRQRSMTLTRLASRGSVRKHYMHQLDFSKPLHIDGDDMTNSASVLFDDDGTSDAGAGVHGACSASPHSAFVRSPVVAAVPRAAEEDPFAHLTSTEQACQQLLDNDGLLSKGEEDAYELRRAAKEGGSAALVNFQSSVALFENRRRTTRLASLRQYIGTSSAASALDSTEALTSADREECDREEYDRDEYQLGGEEREAQHTELKDTGASSTTECADRNRQCEAEVHDDDQEAGPLGALGEDTTLPHHGGNSLSMVRRLSSLSTNTAPRYPPRGTSGEGVQTTTAQHSRINDGRDARRRRGTSAAPIRAPVHRPESVLSKCEKDLLHCKRLSSAALKRECVHLPDSVLRLLPAGAAKTVHRIRGEGARSASLPSSRRTSLGAPQSLFGSRHASAAFAASAPATRAATPLCTVGRGATLVTLPTIALTFDAGVTPCISSRDTASPATATLGGLLAVEDSGRPGTAPRKLTPRPFMMSPALSPRSDAICCSSSAASGRSTPAPGKAATRHRLGGTVALHKDHNDGCPSLMASIAPPTPVGNWDRWMRGGRPL